MQLLTQAGDWEVDENLTSFGPKDSVFSQA